ncbi:MAG TPA: 16S rRNA (cytosine(967)-C(5))-methyltransferase [Gammaproteobacteria bacterium]|jgi:16S rRNA (cytosine967-C5)-methyltransferase|nr:16S rRNA (cytosine(967)-C(5))-methyltransferase RsmB [Gammaproteobacteria bacterium]HAJ77085.1 16S rRNA (cytosine(967)-C(5))-methyltransferase [Gammaproteobacteria bacterium]|tara:strand:- start:23 stop:1324 length:1302 start_codon:yes stop_codon:yes gene_type:complete
MSKPNTRAIAAKILAELQRGNGSLSSHLGKQTGLSDHALLQETLYGACRWFHLLEWLLNQLLSRPLKAKDIELKSLLIVGLYQLRELSIPNYAVINETVSAANRLGKSWGRSLVNGVLRNYLRTQTELEEQIGSAPLSVATSHPGWFVDELLEQWPDQSEQILAHNNFRPPMTLRANLRATTRNEVLEDLHAMAIAASPGALCETSVYLQQPRSVECLPGFKEGKVSVQDEASQLVVGLLALQPGQTVLDACAAPGGKTCHILESERSLTSVFVLDKDSSRLLRVQENLTRLGLEASLACADAADTQSWWNGEGFDRILLDAPCSATGVIRRHPDIKLLRSRESLHSLQESQRNLLHALWPCLKSNGLLLYTTCSILQQENQSIIEDFLQSTDNAKYEGITADWGVECRYGRQLLTGANDGPDGFFFCLLRKT